LLKPREVVDEDEAIYYGYCGYMELDDDKEVIKYIQMGYDPGINFREVYYPDMKTAIVVCSNEEENAYELLKEILSEKKKTNKRTLYRLNNDLLKILCK